MLNVKRLLTLTLLEIEQIEAKAKEMVEFATAKPAKDKSTLFGIG